MIKVSFEANNTEEIKKQMAEYLDAFIEAIEEKVATKKVTKKKTTKKVEAKEPEVVVGKDEVKAAMQKLIEAKGLESTREVLKEFGIDKFSEIKPNKYGEVVASCHSRIEA